MCDELHPEETYLYTTCHSLNYYICRDRRMERPKVDLSLRPSFMDHPKSKAHQERNQWGEEEVGPGYGKSRIFPQQRRRMSIRSHNIKNNNYNNWPLPYMP